MSVNEMAESIIRIFKDYDRRVTRLEQEIDELKGRLGLPLIDDPKSIEPKIIPPHPRLRKPHRGDKTDYASVWHTESEHMSHGRNAYKRTHVAEVKGD